MKQHGAAPRFISKIDAEEGIYLENLQSQLTNSKLYVEFKQRTQILRHTLYNNSAEFDDSAEQSFAKEVFYHVMEESIACIANLEQGAFFAANHHIRALLELYASVEYVLSDIGRKNKFIERFHLYPDMELHNVFCQHDNAFLKLSQEMCEEYLGRYRSLSPGLFEAFGFRNEKDLLKLRT